MIVSGAPLTREVYISFCRLRDLEPELLGLFRVEEASGQACKTEKEQASTSDVGSMLSG